MPSKYWIKLYHEIIDDPKMARLSDRHYRRLIELFLLAGEEDDDGRLPPIEDIAWKLRLDIDELTSDLYDLEKLQFIYKDDDGEFWSVTNFAKRQAPVSSTNRVQRFRKRIIHYPRDQKTQKEIYDKCPSSPGVYKIKFIGDDKCYIGSSKNIRNRIAQHLTEMRTVESNRLHDSYMKFGFDNVEITILEQSNSFDKLPVLESKWLSKFTSSELYNIESVAGKHRDWNANGTECSTDTDTDIEKDTEEKLNAAGAADGKPLPEKKPKRKRTPKIQNREAVIGYFLEKTGLPPPRYKTEKEKRSASVLWWQPTDEIVELAEGDVSIAKNFVDASITRLNGKTISDMNSILKTARAVYAEKKTGKSEKFVELS